MELGYIISVFLLIIAFSLVFTNNNFEKNQKLVLNLTQENTSDFRPEENLENTTIGTTQHISIKNCKTMRNETRIEIKTFHPLLARNIRWSSLPIKVYVDTSECSFGEQNDVIRGINHWNSITKMNLFSMVNNISNADVVVRCTSFIEDYKDTSGIVVLGEAKIGSIVNTGLFNVSKNAIVFIKTRSKKCIQPITVIHEFGHVLGLDHVNDTNNVMYPFENCNERVENYTIETIKNLYKYPSLPELSLENITIKAENSKLIISGVVKNYGLKTSNKTQLDVLVDNSKFYSMNIPKLDIGEGVEFTISGVMNNKFKKISVVIDPYNEVKEMFENNNAFVLEC